MSDRPPWIAGDALPLGLPSGFPLGLPPGASMFALSLWLVGEGNMLGPMSVMSAIAGAASSTAPTRSRSVNSLLSFWRRLLFIGQVLTVCFALASTGYWVGRAGSSARWPFFGEIRASRYAKSSMHNAHSCEPGWGQCLVVAFSEVPTDLSRFSVCSQI